MWQYTMIYINWIFNRRIKISQERLSSFKKELGRVRSGIPTQTFATPSHRYTVQNSDLARCVRRIPSSLFRVDDDTISLGEGSFGKCMKGYMQGFEVCLKQTKGSSGITTKMSVAWSFDFVELVPSRYMLSAWCTVWKRAILLSEKPLCD